MIAEAFFLLASLGQPDAPADAPPDMHAAYTGWTRCLMLQLDEADPEAPARRVADAALRSCERLQRELLAAHSRWVAGSVLSGREKRESRRSMARSVRELRGNVVRIVREMRRD